MSWRFFWVLTALMVAFVINAILLFQEDLDVVVDVELDDKRGGDELKGTIVFHASNRRRNFEAFGLPENLVDSAASRTAQLMKQYNVKYTGMLNEQADELGPLFCSGEMPVWYGALSVLVSEENEERKVLSPSFFILNPQPWYAESYTLAVYEEMELSGERQREATAVGLSAVLTSQEAALLDGKKPWTASKPMEKVVKKYPEVGNKLVQYVALMHVLSEIAYKEPDGICGA